MANKLFKDDDKNEVRSGSFNVGYFLLMKIRGFLELCDCDPGWKSTQGYVDACEEVGMQLDVVYLLKKLMFFDVAISKLMEQHEIQALYLRDKPSLTGVKK